MDRPAAALLTAVLLASAGCESSDEVPQPFTVKYATPAGGHVVTRDVAEYLSVFAAFSENLDQRSLDGVALLREGISVGGPAEVGPKPHELVVRHGALEVGDYEFVLPASLKSADGQELAIELRIPFRVEPNTDIAF